MKIVLYYAKKKAMKGFGAKKKAEGV